MAEQDGIEIKIEHATFPDVIALPDGSVVIVYRAVDGLPPSTTQLMILLSPDGGRTWGEPRPLDITLTLSRDHALWNRPRVVQQHDGGLTVVCDVRLFSSPEKGACLCHERSRVLTWRSFDDGASWSVARFTGVQGRFPSRLLEYTPDTWLLATDYESMRHFEATAQIVNISTDAGENWCLLAMVADLPGVRFRAGSLVRWVDGRLACFLGEESSARVPIHVSFSLDGGLHWSLPAPTAVYGVRPTAAPLRHGRVLCLYYEPLEPMASGRLVRARLMSWQADLSRSLISSEAAAAIADVAIDLEHQGGCGFAELADGKVLVVFDDTNLQGQPCIRGAFIRLAPEGLVEDCLAQRATLSPRRKWRK